MKLEFEYGQGLVGAELPDSTDIFIPGETVADPPCLPQDWDSLYAATWRPSATPSACPAEGPGRASGPKSVVIVIRTRIVQMGQQLLSHRAGGHHVPA